MTNELLTIVFINKNGGTVFEKALKAAKQLTSNILVVDSGSTDESKSYANDVEAQWVEREWPGDFANQRNYAQSLVHTDWILFLDSDEILTDDLKNSIQKAITSSTIPTIYSCERINHIHGKPIRYGSMSHDKVDRLYKRNEAFWVGDVHERLIGKEKIKKKELKGQLLHFSYSSFESWIQKANYYTSLWAKQHEGQKCSFGKIITKTSFAFIKSYFLQLGVLGGRLGLISSWMHAFYTFEKYIKLYDSNRIDRK